MLYFLLFNFPIELLYFKVIVRRQLQLFAFRRYRSIRPNAYIEVASLLVVLQRRRIFTVRPRPSHISVQRNHKVLVCVSRVQHSSRLLGCARIQSFEDLVVQVLRLVFLGSNISCGPQVEDVAAATEILPGNHVRVNHIRPKGDGKVCVLWLDDVKCH